MAEDREDGRNYLLMEGVSPVKDIYLRVSAYIAIVLILKGSWKRTLASMSVFILSSPWQWVRFLSNPHHKEPPNFGSRNRLYPPGGTLVILLLWKKGRKYIQEDLYYWSQASLVQRGISRKEPA